MKKDTIVECSENFINNLFDKQSACTQVRIGNILTNSFLDSGNTICNAISPKMLQSLGLTTQDLKPISCIIRTAKKGALLKVLGQVNKQLPLEFAGSAMTFWTQPLVIEGLAMDLNISLPFLVHNKIDQLHSQAALRLNGCEVVPLLPANAHKTQPNCENKSVYLSSLSLLDKNSIPANSMKTLTVKVSAFDKKQMDEGTEGLMQGADSFQEKTGLQVITSYGIINALGQTEVVIMNATDQPIELEQGRKMGTFDRAYQTTSPVQLAQAAEDDGYIATLEEMLKAPANKETPNNPSKWPVDKQKEWLEQTFKLTEAPALRNDPDKRRKAEAVLLKNIALFGLDDQYGLTTLIEHDITLEGDHKPIREPYRPCNPGLRPDLKERLKKWLSQGVIETSKSPWNFCLVAAPKRNGSIRWCLDTRKLNAITKKDAYRIPNIEDLLSRMAHSKVFSVLDCSGAFHCINIKEEDREKTSFNTPFGAFMFKRLCFGLSNAPATFSRLIEQILQDIPMECIYNYLDDTLISGKSLDDHLDALDKVMEAYWKAGLTLQPDKCTFFQEQVEFLGFQLSLDGISPLDRHLQIIRDWPEPKNLTELKAFLGKINYYRKSIKDSSRLAVPLTNLTSIKKSPTFQFNEEARKSFEALKQALISAPILAFPRFDTEEPFILDTDWSSESIGGQLSQIQDGREVVIQYGSRKLGKYELNLGSNKGELLAAIYFMRKWRYYLQYKPFILRIDHEALRYIKTMEHPRGMTARWLRTLSDFQFQVQF